MPADDLAWLISRFPRFNAGTDPAFTARYLKRLRAEAGVRGFSSPDFLEMIEDYLEAAQDGEVESSLTPLAG